MAIKVWGKSNLIISLLGVLLLFACKQSPDFQSKAEKELAESDYLGAAVEANSMLAQGDTTLTILLLRAEAFQKMGKPYKAIDDLKLAEQKWPQNKDVTYKLGIAYYQNGDSVKARQVFNKIKDAEGRLGSNTWIELSRILYFQDQFDNALSALNKAVEKDASNAMAYYYRGYLQSRFRDDDGTAPEKAFALFSFERALSDFNRSIELDPTFADSYYQRGMVHLNMFNNSKGLNDVARALSLDPSNAYYYTGRAEFYMRIKEYKSAISDLEMALKLNPADSLSQQLIQQSQKALQVK
jgi:tetratricopeptide (TPR) repeat protein